MTAYPDTSFLCALYRAQDNSRRADAVFDALSEPLALTSLLAFEFRQSVRYQTALHARDRRKGYSHAEGARMLADFDNDLASGALVIVPAEWPEVHSIAERLSAQHTPGGAHRALDVLHVATAMHLGARELLTFDANQAALAKAEGLAVRP
jgi:predicted nucleic acid-binding protein